MTVGFYILSKLNAEVKSSGMFSILTDKAPDVYNKENLSLVERFVDGSKSVHEAFVGFHLVRRVQWLIVNAVAELSLSMNDCRGQSYDGAGNMAGRYAGAATLIQHGFKKALYK